MVTALAINVNEVGARTLLSVRPERVIINPKGPESEEAIEGRIEELIYLGDHIRTRMTVAGHDDFIVKLPNNSGHQVLSEGETTSLGWVAEDCRALDYNIYDDDHV